MIKNSISFPKQFFFQNDFIDTKNAVLTGRPNFSQSITGNDLKKGPQKMQKFFKVIYFKMFFWRGRKQLESPDDFFRQAAEIFPLDIQKILICKFSKGFSPESFYWNWESSFDNSATFFSRNAQKIYTVSKKEKNLETKPFSIKCYLGHVECSSNSPSKNSKRGRKFPAQCLKMMKKFNCFPKQFFFKMIL